MPGVVVYQRAVEDLGRRAARTLHGLVEVIRSKPERDAVGSGWLPGVDQPGVLVRVELVQLQDEVIVSAAGRRKALVLGSGAYP